MPFSASPNAQGISPWIPGLRTLMTLDALFSMALCLFLIKNPAVAIPVGLALAALTAAIWLFFSLYPKTLFFGKVTARGVHPGKSVAFTFDDGPHPEFTNRLLDVLKEAGVKATFFVTGKNARAFPETLQRIHAEGHSIGNHGWNHLYLAFHSNGEIAAEIDKTQQAVVEITGQAPKLFRPPYGCRDYRVLGLARKRGLETVTWSVTSWDWRCPGIDRLLMKVQRRINPGAILLFHDGAEDSAQTDRSQTVEVVKRLIPKLKGEGYAILPVDDIL